jgi:hypothetical protein
MNSSDLLQLVYNQLIGPDGGPAPTSAEDRVRLPGDLPTQSDDYPLWKLKIESEVKQSIGRGSVGFTTIATIRLVGEVSAPADRDDPLTSSVEAKLQLLKREGEVAIINSYPLFSYIQQLVSVQTQFAYTLKDKHLAGIQSDYAFEFYEDGSEFAPTPSNALTEIIGPDTNHPGVGLHITFPD